jgi:hypothetical protein
MNDILRWVEQGMTHQQIADHIRETTGEYVSRSTVSAALHRAGKTNRIRYEENLPWQVRNEHANLYHAIMLRLAARHAQGQILSPRDTKRLAAWKKALAEENAVIHYEADTTKGWFKVRRRKGIDLGYIREPEGIPKG